MLETHLSSPITRQRLRTGAAAEHIDAFADWLHLKGYKPTSIDNGLTALAAWTDWMLTSGFTAHNLLSGFEACKLAVSKEQRVRYSRGPNQQSITAASLFIRFLQLQGKLPLPIAKPSVTERWPILGEFRSWMRSHRGLTETTLDVYQGILPGLLDVLGDDARAYSAEALRTFVLDRARPHGIQRAKSIVVAVRSFLRFLGVTGRCLPGMEHAIPGFASWQLSSVPRFLATEDVERVIDSCAGQPFELRDRAVLLLLARLALRASEVAQLKLSDIDWRNGGIRVCGKGRRQESLPLPQEIGDAILRYVNKGRPSLHVPEVFTTVLAPLHPLTRAAVTHIVRAALRRAGSKRPSMVRMSCDIPPPQACSAKVHPGWRGCVLRHRNGADH
jgi:site-specific recombinase XerD